MALDNLKIPKERPSIKDQIPVSRFKYTPVRKYTSAMSGIDLSKPLPPRSISKVVIAEISENDYIENTYIDDYFE